MNIAFILGCARSGTSILGELIASHPEVKYIYEAHHIWEKAGLGENESHRLTEVHATHSLKRKIRKRFEKESSGAGHVVEKCPRNALRIPFLREVFPEAKIIHIIRDGRDVACSLLPGIGGADWRHLKPPNWQKLFEEDHGIIRCAKVWKTTMEIALNDLSGIPQFSIKYEELVENPDRSARKILRYLELPEHSAVLAFAEKIQDSTVDSYQPQKQVKWYRDNHQMRVGRWRENLKEEEAQEVENLLQPLLTRLGYIRGLNGHE